MITVEISDRAQNKIQDLLANSHAEKVKILFRGLG
jgi:hypothetical protein